MQRVARRKENKMLIVYGPLDGSVKLNINMYVLGNLDQLSTKVVIKDYTGEVVHAFSKLDFKMVIKVGILILF